MEYALKRRVTSGRNSIVPVELADRIVDVVGLSRDIGGGGRRAQSDMLKEPFFSSIRSVLSPVTHSFANLLTPASEYPCLLAQYLKSAPDASILLDQLKFTCERMVAINENIRRLLYGHEGSSSLINVYDLVESVLMDINFSPTVVRVSEQDKRCTIYGPYNALYHTINDLVQNAIIAMVSADERKLFLKIGQGIVSLRDAICRLGVTPGKYCYVAVKDSGHGVSPAYHENLFDPFVSSRNGEGFGLGLSCVYRVMHHIKGDVVYRSGGRMGALFVLLFPTNTL